MAAPSHNNPQQSWDIHPNVNVGVPPAPTVRSQDEFLSLSPEQQAAILHTWQEVWLRPTPAVDVPSGFRISVPDPPARVETENWKQPPTPEERESTRDWNKC